MAYKSWADLEKNETEGETYEVEAKKERSNWVHIAPHGGRLELLTLEMAKAASAERGQSFAALNVLDKRDSERLRINETNYDAPWALDIVTKTMWGITYHAVGDPVGDDPDEFAYVSGLSEGHRDKIIDGFKKLDIFAKVASKEGGSGSDKALTNKTSEKKGVRIELSRALRNKLVKSGNANDTSQGYTKLWTDIISMLMGVTGPADVYQSWKSLAANEKEGTDYRIEAKDRPSNWSHIAIHGGKAELLTAELAKACADEREQKYYAFVAAKSDYNDRLRIPAIKFDEPQCVKLQSSVLTSISYHGVSGDTEEVRINGLNDTYVKRLSDALKKAGFKVTDKTTEGGNGTKDARNPKNICNKTKQKKGIHVELTRVLRDKMSKSGKASDLSQGTTELFTKFVKAVAEVTGTLDVYSSWKSLTRVEKEGEDYEIEIARRGSAYSHLAIHGGGMELVTTELAQAVAKAGEQSIYSLTGIKKKHNDRMRIPSTKFDEPKCLKIQSEVDFSISYHGVGDQKDDPKGGVIRVGGLQTKHRDWVIKALKERGLRAEVMRQPRRINAESGGTEGSPDDHASKDNIVNKNRQKAGVQIELNRTMRDSMAKSGSASDLSQGTTDVFDKFVDAVSGMAIATDRHQSWASFEANEKEGRDYRIDKTLNPDSNVAHIAIHGGGAECMTSDLAEEAAAPKNQNFFALVATHDKFNERLRIPSTIFAHPDAVEMQKAVYFTFSYHGISDRDKEPEGGQVFVGGMDIQYRDEVAEALKKKGFNVTTGGIEWGSTTPKGAEKEDNQSPKNIANKNQQPGGIQLELTRSLRDRMSSTGNACDENAAKTQVFRDFLSAVRSVSQKPDAPEQETGEQGCIRYFINDFNLDQPKLGFKLLTDTEYAPAVSPRLFNLQIPSWHGQMPVWHDPVDTMKVTFQVQIRASTASMLRRRWDDFVGLCGVGKFVPVRLERYRGIYLSEDPEYDPHDRNKSMGEYAHARLESMSAPEFENGNKSLTTTVVFDVPAGMWRSHKVYYQYYAKHGGHQKCVVAKVSTAPVVNIIIRVQGGKGLVAWSLVDEQSNTGVAWSDPPGINLNDGEWVYADTNTMRAYISKKRDWPGPNESFDSFIKRIKGEAAWQDYRYIRNGPLNLTCKVEWKDADPDKDVKAGIHHTSGVFVSMTDSKGKPVDREMAIMTRAARF
ncbi:poly-gamma-glutamate hydrolase family protein [Streptomyces sp. 5-10]|uniref:poly-gamma-glutamate hydrolase family protein n=1 Tax=Streptomyces sp. 5-10 TaxID=878925 RepID=UPI00168B2875|nr:poly-gamma-glutamate hydrolase family protein [Streptomyces sp. 5-10]MBD3004889.1 poly-gamma-glutamate hydrolase family protein [Streptomyces sp. 5-10]